LPILSSMIETAMLMMMKIVSETQLPAAF